MLAPNLGLMQVGQQPAGSGAFSSGLLVFDGVAWRQVSTVCGSRSTGRIAFASAQEWWTVSSPALATDTPNPITLCRFVNGQVVASYAVAARDYDGSYARMHAAACTSPSNCWFAGDVTDRPDIGTFLLHWNGETLSRIVHPSARAIVDAVPFGDGVLGVTATGTAPGDAAVSPDFTNLFLEMPRDTALRETNGPRLLRRLGADGSIAVRDWPRVIEDPDAVAAGRTRLVDLHAADSDGGRVWIAGRGSRSAPAPETGGDDTRSLLTPVDQQPLLASLPLGASEPVAATWVDPDAPAPAEVITDIAAIPGTRQAWVALMEPASFNRAAEPQAGSRLASVARVELSADGLQARVVERLDITRNDIAIGDAAHVSCSGPADCWMVTAGGWVYRWADPDTVIPLNTDPAIQRLITVRPADARTPRDEPISLIADAAPYVAPDIEPDVTGAAPAPRRVPALFRVLGKPKVVKGRIQIRIQLRRRARVQLVGRRGGKIVARTKRRTLKPGRHTLRLKPKSRKQWPTALRFITTDLELKTPAADPDDVGGEADDTITTG
ncbi:hypothetical protein LRS13_23080 [Svornostia abyssi]|uniref:Uncharacterized protein n=1 Tax=Svornostia abyssi TaxID=2898438 RepID=A0ABY5PFT9_9ACTN|nr:hypothetical protein LRS13_23080 [Parviterribacteraceae bacterium J379]